MIHYRNTDIDLEAPFDLTELTTILSGRGLMVLAAYLSEDGLWRATLEADYELIDSKAHGQEPERTTHALLSVVESLQGDAKELWNGCSRRVFDLGFDCGKEPWPLFCEVAPESLARIAAVGAELRITMYQEIPLPPGRQKL